MKPYKKPGQIAAGVFRVGCRVEDKNGTRLPVQKSHPTALPAGVCPHLVGLRPKATQLSERIKVVFAVTETGEREVAERS
ncbi:hypothetical protein GJAV_G00178110 [Gymnothorax javanicus]|nr:hypothetical protein GJAV_G00178110 [Gymnothorax javanicus]